MANWAKAPLAENRVGKIYNASRNLYALLKERFFNNDQDCPGKHPAWPAHKESLLEIIPDTTYSDLTVPATIN